MKNSLLILIGLVLGFIGGFVFHDKKSHVVKYLPSKELRYLDGIYEVSGSLKPLNYKRDDQFEFVRIFCNTQTNQCEKHSLILFNEGAMIDFHQSFKIKGYIGDTILAINTDDNCIDSIIEINTKDTGHTLLKKVKKSDSSFCVDHANISMAELGTYYAEGKIWLAE